MRARWGRAAALIGVVATIALAVNTPAQARTAIDHGSNVEGGCGAYYSVLPDPATPADTLTARLEFSCAPWQTAWGGHIELAPGPGVSYGGSSVVPGSVAPIAPTSCVQDPATNAVQCVFPPQPAGVYTATFSWSLISGGTGSVGGHYGYRCWELPEGGWWCNDTLNIVVAPASTG